MTEKQKQFCIEYMIDFNATQAAIRSGYSEKTAQAIGSENLTKPLIKEYIKKSIIEKLPMREQIIIENIQLWRRMVEDPNTSESGVLKASEYLSRYSGMFEDVLRLKGDQAEPLKIVFSPIDKPKE
jgi:hypothetical protein